MGASIAARYVCPSCGSTADAPGDCARDGDELRRADDPMLGTEVGGYRSPSCLAKPFAAVTRKVGLKKRITPRAMRRSFQDLCRTAEVRDVVWRAPSAAMRPKPCSAATAPSVRASRSKDWLV